jgi:peptide/nickel transport system substrate-binding protein
MGECCYGTKAFNKAAGVILVLLSIGAQIHSTDAQELRIGARSDIIIDPHSSWAASNTQYYFHYLGYLNWLDANDKVIPSIAESVTPLSDNLWEIKIGPRVKFETGEPVTSADVIASYDRARTLPNAIGTYAGLFAGIGKFVAVDDRTIHVETLTPYPTLPATLTQIAIIPANVAKTATQADFASGKANVSSGAYRFVEYVPGDRLVLERNDSYSGPKAVWKRVTFRFLTNNATRVAALLSGDVDVIDGVPPEDVATIKKDARFEVYSGPSDRVIFFAVDNLRDESPFVTDDSGHPLKNNPLKDTRVRQAFSLALDRGVIRDRVMSGFSYSNNQIVPKGLGGYADNIPAPKQDLEKAKRLMKEAGWENGFRLALQCPDGRYVNAAKICQVAAQMFGRIGVKVSVDMMPYGVFASRMTNQTGERGSMMLFGWGASSSGEANVLQNVIHTYDKQRKFGSWNIGHYSNPEIDALIEKSLDTLDATKRHAIQAQAVTRAIEDAAVIPLHTQSVIVGMRKNLTYTIQADECTLADQILPKSKQEEGVR